jgi:hypothetical protein
MEITLLGEDTIKHVNKAKHSALVDDAKCLREPQNSIFCWIFGFKIQPKPISKIRGVYCLKDPSVQNSRFVRLVIDLLIENRVLITDISDKRIDEIKCLFNGWIVGVFVGKDTGTLLRGNVCGCKEFCRALKSVKVN